MDPRIDHVMSQHRLRLHIHVKDIKYIPQWLRVELVLAVGALAGHPNVVDQYFAVEVL